jgi:predicted DNA-binding transcriptional regulator AlpA
MSKRNLEEQQLLVLTRAVPTIALRRKDAAQAFGIGTTLFDKLVKNGHLPAPVKIPESSVEVFDYQGLLAAFYAWEEANEAERNALNGHLDPWADV